MQDANALVLEILKQAKGLKMSLFEQGEASSTLRHYSQCTVSFPEIEKLCDEAVFVLKKVNRKANDNEELIKELRKIGTLLWNHLLTSSVRNRLKSCQTPDLTLSIDEELINIPWELLHSGKNFLCLEFNIGRLVRTEEDILPPKYRSFSSVLSMLVLANPTNDLKSAYQEGVHIKSQFDRRRDVMHIDFKSTSIDRLYVKKNICDYDIIHFAGHCEYDPDNHQDSGWVMSDGRFTVQDILTMGPASFWPSLIFSNACYSAASSSDIIDTDYQVKNYSLAQAFLFSGVRHYIGATRKIEDTISLTYSKEFYTQLIAGRSVGQSVRLSRLKLVKEYGLASLHWASYLLYGDPNFSLFRPRIKQASHKTGKNLFLHKKALAGFSLAVAAASIFIYLYMWLPSINPNTYRLYLKSQNLFKKGNNESVVLLCEQIIRKEPSFLAAYPVLADAYQRSGDTKSAVKYYFDYAFYSEKKNDKRDLASAYSKIGWFFHLRGEYPKAYEFYNKALTLSLQNKDKLNEADVLGKLAVWYIDKEDYSKALELLTKSSEINRERQHIYKHKYNLACDYFNLGLLFTDKDDFKTAREFYDKSRMIFEKAKFKNELSDFYFNMGEIFLFEKQYQKALAYYIKGLKMDQEQGNKFNFAGDYNMIGELHMETGNFSEAESFFRQAVAFSQQIDLQPELAAAYRNLGHLYKQKRQKSTAREYLSNALEIYSSIDTHDYQGIKNELLELDSF